MEDTKERKLELSEYNFPVDSMNDEPTKKIDWVWIHESYTTGEKSYYKRSTWFGTGDKPAEMLAAVYKTTFYGLMTKWEADNKKRL